MMSLKDWIGRFYFFKWRVYEYLKRIFEKINKQSVFDILLGKMKYLLVYFIKLCLSIGSKMLWLCKSGGRWKDLNTKIEYLQRLTKAMNLKFSSVRWKIFFTISHNIFSPVYQLTSKAEFLSVLQVCELFSVETLREHS